MIRIRFKVKMINLVYSSHDVRWTSVMLTTPLCAMNPLNTIGIFLLYCNATTLQKNDILVKEVKLIWHSTLCQGPKPQRIFYIYLIFNNVQCLLQNNFKQPNLTYSGKRFSRRVFHISENIRLSLYFLKRVHYIAIRCFTRQRIKRGWYGVEIIVPNFSVMSPNLGPYPQADYKRCICKE